MRNFVAIDFETANAKRSSICSMGLVFVRDGKPVRTFYSPVRPIPNYYHFFNTSVHGLSTADTDNAPDFFSVWRTIADALEGLPLVAHNSAFDRSCLRAVFEAYGRAYPDYPFYCTLRAARAALPTLPNYQLDTVARYLGFPVGHHHHALDDALACAHIATALGREPAAV